VGRFPRLAENLSLASSTYHSPLAYRIRCLTSGYLQEEPDAGKPHVRICEGESRMAELLDQTLLLVPFYMTIHIPAQVGPKIRNPGRFERMPE
jgi:hypothetical protein